MNWDRGGVIASETNKLTKRRRIKESNEIRRRASGAISLDEGAYTLSHTWDSLLQRAPEAGEAGEAGPTRRAQTGPFELASC